MEAMEMEKNVRRYRFIALAALLAVSAYPLVMGLKLVALQLMYGGVQLQDYARWVIPYTAVCVAALAACALYPAFGRLGKFAAPAATMLALALFLGLELFVEGVTIQSEAAKNALTAQLLSCVYTPRAVWAFSGIYDDSYKIHYYLVSAVILLLCVRLFYGFGGFLSGGKRERKAPLAMQAAAFALFLGLCVLANFTGFFREKTDYLAPLPAFLTGFFFIVLGTSAGIYLGSWLIGRGAALAVWLPAAVSTAACAVMYYGEYRMFGDTLYRFGAGWFFEGLPGLALAPIDLLIIVLGGAAAAGAMALGRRAWLHGERT
jgi:hypothetical protein